MAAIQVKDKGALDDLIDKTKPKKTGEESGATLYQENDTVFAVKDDTVVFASDQRALTQALKRADGDDHLDEDAFNEGLDGLPENALARVYTDLAALLKSDPSTADDAKSSGSTLCAAQSDGGGEGQQLDVDFRVRTRGRPQRRRPADRSRRRGPRRIKREGEVGLGIRDLAHIVKFAESAGQAVDPPASATTPRPRRRSTSSSE